MTLKLLTSQGKPDNRIPEYNQEVIKLGFEKVKIQDDVADKREELRLLEEKHKHY